MQTVEPGTLRAGLSWTWSRSLSEYPADSWTLRYWLKNAASHIEIAAAPDGTAHVVSVAAATTATYAPGRYGWVALVEAGAEKFQVGAGSIEVLPRIDTEGVLEQRSTARRIYDGLLAAYEASLISGVRVEEYTIGDRHIKFKTAGDFIKELESWRAQVAAEEAGAQIADGLGNPRRLYTRFV